MSELRPCPFCGGEANTDTLHSAQIEAVGAQVECGDCGARGKLFQAVTEEQAIAEAIAAWNRRTPDSELREALEEYVDGLYFGRRLCGDCSEYDHDCGCIPSVRDRAKEDAKTELRRILRSLLTDTGGEDE